LNRRVVKRARPSASPSSDRAFIYPLHVELRDIAPAIWRRVLVPSEIKLNTLHRVLQTAMGWTDSHLHAFGIEDKKYGIPDPEWPEQNLIDERRVTLASCLTPGVIHFTYQYDFGDGWEHAIRVETSLPVEDTRSYPLCIAGANACPPEDVGGTPGYLDFVQAIADPLHPEHLDMLRWCGGAFDPRGFDLNSVNAALRRLKILSMR
jgi:Plasmid pRiA4b ORF-3-like protein